MANPDNAFTDELWRGSFQAQLANLTYALAALMHRLERTERVVEEHEQGLAELREYCRLLDQRIPDPGEEHPTTAPGDGAPRLRVD